MESILLSSIVFAALGFLSYLLDKKMGTRMHRWWYNLTHKEKLSSDIQRGFIAGRGIQPRLIAAIILAILAFVVMYVFTSGFKQVAQTVLYAALGIPALLIGMYIAQFVFKGGGKGKIGDAVEYIEKVENKEVDIKKDILKGAAAVGKGIKEIKDEITDDFKKEEKVAEKKVEEKIEEVKEEIEDEIEEEKKDWRKGIEDFRKR